MKCIMCKSELIEKKTNFIADLEDCIVIVKDVPSFVCPQCGEKSYSHDVTVRLEKIVNKMRNSLTEVAIIHYDENAA